MHAGTISIFFFQMLLYHDESDLHIYFMMDINDDCIDMSINQSLITEIS